MIDEITLTGMPEAHKTYWMKAQDFVTKNEVQWEEVKRETPEYEAWVSYFRQKGFTPAMIKMADRGTILSILVPAKFPSWFDPFKPDISVVKD